MMTRYKSVNQQILDYAFKDFKMLDSNGMKHILLHLKKLFKEQRVTDEERKIILAMQVCFDAGMKEGAKVATIINNRNGIA